MKLSKAQSGWVKQLVEESTARERDELKRKEEATTAFASALITWRESTGVVQRAWAEYKAATGEGRKSVAERLHIDNAEQNIIMAAASPARSPAGAGSSEERSASGSVRPLDVPDLDGPAAA